MPQEKGRGHTEKPGGRGEVGNDQPVLALIPPLNSR